MSEQFDFENIVKNAVEEALKERGHINILMAGRTGVGKSTLINAVFQGNFATTGQGRPVTQHTREIKKKDIPLSIFDTRGLEMQDYSETLENLKSLVSEKAREIDPNKHIHLAWLCISEDSRRVESAEENLVKMLSDYMPVIVVITKIRSKKSDEGFRAEVQKILPLAKNVIRVRAIEEETDEDRILEPEGLKELVELTMQVIPEGRKRAFVASQKVDIQLKKNQSRIIVAGAAASAAGVATTPIPFSDSMLIVPFQVAMLAGISTTFGLSFNESFLASIIGIVISAGGATLAGKSIVSGLLKLIPGAGSIAGGLIGATTAGALTTALGETYISVLVMLFDNNDGESPTPEKVKETFKKQYLLKAAEN